MRDKTRLQQSWTDTVFRTIKTGKTGFQKSVETATAYDGSAGCAGNEMIAGLWTSAAIVGYQDEPDLHAALDRLMARVRIS